MALSLLFLLLTVACSSGEPTRADIISVGECVSISGLQSARVPPVKRVACDATEATIDHLGSVGVYRVAVAVELKVAVNDQATGDDLARVHCHGDGIVPGKSIYVFPTDASFKLGFHQFLCLAN